MTSSAHPPGRRTLRQAISTHIRRHAVIAAGETESGATVHLVDYDYDTGPILAQTTVQVLPDDTPEKLETRVKAAEQALLVKTVGELGT